MELPMRYWDRDKRYGRSFWLIHAVGCTAVFLMGVRTASKAALPMAVWQVTRRILAK